MEPRYNRRLRYALFTKKRFDRSILLNIKLSRNEIQTFISKSAQASGENAIIGVIMFFNCIISRGAGNDQLLFRTMYLSKISAYHILYRLL